MAMLLPWPLSIARKQYGLWLEVVDPILTAHSVNARGLMSGILQQGYSLGYVFAACANLGVGGGTETFKTVFWIAGLSFLWLFNKYMLTND
jgi:hypothetical protein